MPDIIPIIRARMAELGVTQQELADALGVQQPLISSYLRGVQKPGLKNLERMLAFLGLDVTAAKRRQPT